MAIPVMEIEMVTEKETAINIVIIAIPPGITPRTAPPGQSVTIARQLVICLGSAL